MVALHAWMNQKDLMDLWWSWLVLCIPRNPLFERDSLFGIHTVTPFMQTANPNHNWTSEAEIGWPLLLLLFLLLLLTQNIQTSEDEVFPSWHYAGLLIPPLSVDHFFAREPAFSCIFSTSPSLCWSRSLNQHPAAKQPSRSWSNHRDPRAKPKP